MKKNFVLDTNVVLADPQAIFRFEDNNVVLPITVLEELDKFKRDLNELGRHSREAARLIDRFRERGNLARGVPLEGGGKLRVLTNLGEKPPLPYPTLGATADSLILATALLLKKREDLPVVFITRDINLRLRADAVGLKAVNYEEPDSVTVEEMYSGWVEYPVTVAQLRRFLVSGRIAAPQNGWTPNQCVTLAAKGRGETERVLGRFESATGYIRKLPLEINSEIWGIQGRNDEQRFALDLLLDDALTLVTLSGKAGTGKTLLAIAAGLQKVVDEKIYSKLVISRPVMPLGRELGFLPGSMGEKMQPWMEPVYDNLELLAELKSASLKKEPDDGRAGRKKRAKNPAEDLLRAIRDSGILEVQPLTYIRGRSLPRQFLIVDEAQNLTQHEVKTIITRAGEGTKVVLTGDPYQIDNPFLDTTSNGLSITVERFKSQKPAGHITLVRGERSELSELASNLL